MSKAKDLSELGGVIVTDGSNVGIGTSSPLARLDVESGTGNVGFNYGTLSSPDRGNLWYDTDGTGWRFNIGKAQAGSFTPQITIQDNGRVGIGTSSPDSLVHLAANTGAKITLESTDLAIATNEVIGEIDFYSNDESGIGAASRGSISLIAQDAAGAGSMLFKTSNAASSSAERMRIDSSGNVLVGQSSTTVPGLGNTTTGLSLTNNGYIFASKADDNVAWFNRNTSDGSIISLRKNGSPIGRVGTFANSTSYCGASSGIYFNGANINPTTGDPTVRTDNANDIGQASQRFKDLYLGGGVYLGGTGAANKLDDYEEGTFTIGLNVASGSPSFSISNTTGYYIKVGKLVHFNWYSGAISVTNGGGGNVSLTGLPFFSNSAANNYSAFQYLHGNAFSQTTTGGYVNVNATNAFFIIQNQVGANVGLQTGTRYIMVRGTYYSA